MLEKDPNERMTINEILNFPIMIEHAAKYLPKDVFVAEFPNYKPNKLVADKKVVIKPNAIESEKQVAKPDFELSDKAEEGVYDTSAVYGDKIVSFGKDYSR